MDTAPLELQVAQARAGLKAAQTAHSYSASVRLHN
jgi:hypothetical protein